MPPIVRRLLAWSAACALLAGVFTLYTRPGVTVAIAELMWACFN